MDVFTQARAELSLLEDKERRLRKELLGVRTAITTQRAKITELLRTRAAAINHLPTEILLFILDLDVHSNPYPGRNYELAAVCRRWRDVVLDSPSLWTTIHVADLKPSSIITHLERSRGAFLDIVIDSTDRGQAYHFAHVPSLQIVSSCADRWRNLSITIRGCIYYSDDGRVPRMECILRRINHLKFPSLTCAKLVSHSDFQYLDFLSAGHAPVLEHLELSNLALDLAVEDFEDFGFPPVAALKTLKLDFDGPVGPSLPYMIPAQALTVLSLTGHTDSLSLRQDSLHFPFTSKTQGSSWMQSWHPILNDSSTFLGSLACCLLELVPNSSTFATSTCHIPKVYAVTLSHAISIPM